MAFRIWALHCPFRTNGTPVLGSFGKRIEPVVVMTMATWTELVRAHPSLALEQFQVGTEDVAAEEGQ